MKKLLLGWAWGQVRPSVKTWLRTRALKLPAAKEQLYAQDLAQRFGIDEMKALSILQEVEGTLQNFAVAGVDSLVL